MIFSILTLFLNTIMCGLGIINYSYLFLILYPACCLNQAFPENDDVLLFKIARVVDWSVSLILFMQFIEKLSFITLFLTVSIFIWHLRFESTQDFFIRVNIWHLWIIFLMIVFLFK